MTNIKDELSISGGEKISDFPKKFNKLIRVVERLINVVAFLLVVVVTILGQELLSGRISKFFAFFRFNWNGLSEGYQLLLLGIPVAIFVGIVVNFINKKYVEPLINRKTY